MAFPSLSNLDNIKICSYNMHGFYNGLPLVKSLCNDFNVILLQEHWLNDFDLYKLNNIHNDFSAVGVSAMLGKSENSIIVGRPFGGVAILYNKFIFKNIKILEKDCTDGRFIAINFVSSMFDLIVHCVYFPCRSSSGLQNYITDFSSVCSKIESLLINFPNSSHLIMGDYNFECNDNSPGFNLFKDLINDYDLFCCDSLNSSMINFSYFHETLNQQSWLDHCFVTNNLKHFVTLFEIFDSGLNCSDHNPISCSLKANCKVNADVFERSSQLTTDVNAKAPPNASPAGPSRRHQYRDHWGRADLLSYYSYTASLLQSLHVPTTLLQCAVGCACPSHCSLIDNYYSSLINSLNITSGHCVPKIPVIMLLSLLGILI